MLWADVNGRIVPADEATISVWDRGFLFGDGVFETIRIHESRPILWEFHINRLHASAAGVGMNGVPSSEELLQRAIVLMKKSCLASGSLYIQITRGSVGHRSDREMPKSLTVFLSIDPYTCMSEEQYAFGVEVITVDDIRSGFANLKTTNLLPRTLARLQANKQGAYEALFCSTDGHVFEGTTTNIMICRDGRITTPPLSDRLLAGATRAILLKLASRLVAEVCEENVDYQDMLNADEVMLTGTSAEVVGVVKVDGHVIADGRVGNVARTLRAGYRHEVLGE